MGENDFLPFRSSQFQLDGHTCQSDDFGSRIAQYMCPHYRFILVDEADYEAAVRLLEQNEMIPEQLKYCPFCGSPDIKFVLKKEHRLRAVMSAIASLLAATPPGNNHWEYVCHACGGKFEKPVAEFHSAEI